MAQWELWFSLGATAVSSPFLVKAFERFVDWRKGRLSKLAALEAALEEAKEAIAELERRKRSLREARQEEVDGLNEEIRSLKERIALLRLRLINLGKNPDDDFIT